MHNAPACARALSQGLHRTGDGLRLLPTLGMMPPLWIIVPCLCPYYPPPPRACPTSHSLLTIAPCACMPAASLLRVTFQPPALHHGATDLPPSPCGYGLSMEGGESVGRAVRV